MLYNKQALVCCQIAEGLVREGRIREPYLHCFGNEDAFVDFDDYLVSCSLILIRVAEVKRGHGGPPLKSLDSNENFKPKHTLFIAN